MGLVLDTGALIAFDRGAREVAALVEASRRRRDPVTTSSGCVAQAWRVGGERQALLARLLTGVVEHGLDPDVSRRVGSLCGAASVDDVVDAHVALIAGDHDIVVTCDVIDLGRILRASHCAALVRPC